MRPRDSCGAAKADPKPLHLDPLATLLALQDVHTLADWCSLNIGRSLSIVPSGWKSLGPLHDAFNAEHGRSRLNERGSDALGIRRRAILVTADRLGGPCGLNRERAAYCEALRD